MEFGWTTEETNIWKIDSHIPSIGHYEVGGKRSFGNTAYEQKLETVNGRDRWIVESEVVNFPSEFIVDSESFLTGIGIGPFYNGDWAHSYGKKTYLHIYKIWLYSE